MRDNIFAYTEPGQSPGYFSLNKQDGKYFLSVRSSGEEKVSEIEIPFEVLNQLSTKLASE